jgi:cyclophilin family peptidyl-prolyl cis-trans isomerase
LARRRAVTRGFDRGGGRRSIFRSRYAKIFYVVGLVGLLGSLLPLLILNGSNPHSGTSGTASEPAIRRIDSVTDSGAVADKPQFSAPPEFVIETGNDFVAVMELEGGEVRVELFDNVAPVHVNNFVFLARQGFYDGITFHRVLEGFVAQAGDPTASGTGGAGYTLPDEVVGDSGTELSLADVGIISMARGPEGASSSQFFITMAPQGQLDDLQFTAFGRVIEGIEHVLTIPLRDPQIDPNAPAGAPIISLRIEETAPDGSPVAAVAEAN